MWSASSVRDWVDRPGSEADPIARARLRVQHLVVLLYLLIGLPYVALFNQIGLRASALSLLFVVLFSVAVLFGLTRRGQGTLGGALISIGFFVNIVIALIARGGMDSNSAAWLLLAPVLAFFMVGPRHGALISGFAMAAFAGLWGLEQAGVVLSPGLPAALLEWMPLVDYPLIAFAVGAMLWAQAGLWEGTIRELDDANWQMRAEVAERLRAEHAAQEAVRVRSTFLATMSHELRTPMNGVLGLTEVLLGTPLDRDQRQLAETVRSSGRLLRALLDDVLDFSKIDSGQEELEQLPLDLPALCAEVAQLWQGPAAEQGVSLEVIDGEVPRWVLGDPTKLRQIVGNLLSNAVKFTSQGHIWVHTSAAGQRLLVTVEDTGIGMSAAASAHIFEPFRQADGSTRRRHGGTGLGLAISRRLARLMGGELSVSSTEGLGSVFTLSLPLLEATPTARAPAAPAPTLALSGLRVLVAEDNRVNQLVVRRLLERHGVCVDIVPNGEEAVSAWSRLSPDVILMDCQMPVCDGYEATRRLRSLGAEQPIIALTASAMPGDRERCLEAGMDEHLGKPIQIESLVRLLQQLHTRRRPDRVVAGRAVGDD